jgi:hypothetical protein
LEPDTWIITHLIIWSLTTIQRYKQSITILYIRRYLQLEICTCILFIFIWKAIN